MNSRNLIVLFAFLFVAAFSGGCSNKSSPDPGPAFTLKSMEMKLDGVETGFAALKRDEPTAGPQIQIHMSGAGEIVSIEKKIVCGSVTLAGRKLGAADPDLLNFRLADEEFPGLNRMPMVTPCKLSIVATNSIGSTATKTIPMTLSFDKNPTLDIQRSVLAIGQAPTTARFEVPLETYRIKNTLLYPLEMRFTPTRSAKSLMHFQYLDNPSAQPTGDGYYYLPVDLEPTRIEIIGVYGQQTGDMVRTAGFTIPVGGEVDLSAYAQIPAQYTQMHSVPAYGIIMGSHWDKFAGAYVTNVYDFRPQRSLAIPRGFSSTEEDLANPAYIAFPNETPFDGTQIDISVATKTHPFE